MAASNLDLSPHFVRTASTVRAAEPRPQVDAAVKTESTEAGLFRRALALAGVGTIAAHAPFERGDVFWSDVAFEIYGLDPAGGAPSLETLLGLVHPDDRDRIQRLRMEVFERRDPRAEYRCRIVRPDGAVRLLEHTVEYEYSEDGEPIGILATVRDVTDGEAARDSSSETNEATARIQQLATVGAAAAMFAHEVGNPLNNMYLHAQMLQRRLTALEIPDRVTMRVDGVLTEIRRLIDLLQEFRSFNGREPGLSATPVDGAALLDDVIALQSCRDDGSKIRIEATVDEGLPPVRANSDKLKQVFINLVKNAVEAMPDGGTVFVRATSNDTAVTVEVQDTGVGIPAGVDVFAPFKTTKTDGSGLGLAIVRKIINAHGGTITYSSEPGVGTKFTVVLPVCKS